MHLDLEVYDSETIEGTAEAICQNTDYITMSSYLFEDWTAVDGDYETGDTYVQSYPLYGGCIEDQYWEIDTDLTIWWEGGGPDERYDGLAAYGCGEGLEE